MRLGQNPAKIKGLPAYKPTQVGLASLTYVPTQEGYWREARRRARRRNLPPPTPATPWNVDFSPLPNSAIVPLVSSPCAAALTQSLLPLAA